MPHPCWLTPPRLRLQERLKGLKKAHGSMEMGATTLDMVIGGMRGITVGL